MSNDKSWKYTIKFTQSLTSGIIAFHGDYSFDNEEEFTHSDNGAKALRDMLQSLERIFQAEGYKVASIIPNNLKDLADKTKK